MSNDCCDYARVLWRVADLESLRPEWSDEQCHEFLEDNEEEIREAMIERGWEAIEYLLLRQKIDSTESDNSV